MDEKNTGSNQKSYRMIRFTLRIYSKKLYDKLVASAEKNDRSLNAEILHILKKHFNL